MWIPLMDYAVKKGVSLSTLRRYIKSGRVQHRIENGKYFLFCEDSQTQDELKQLEHELRSAQEEILELKMLVAVYEESLFQPKLDHAN